MSYRLGVDVGGTFTDLLLINESTGQIHTAKVPSTPEDSSIGVLNGVEKVCLTAGVDPKSIGQVMHGTTVATNTILTGSGAKVGLVTTQGYRQVLQVARSFVPGGLGGWVIYNKSDNLAPLECTIEIPERIGAKGDIVHKLDEKETRKRLKSLKNKNIQSLTISLVNSFANPEHEERVRKLAEDELPGVPVSISSEVIPEMQEYERAITTVANSYVRPVVSKYVRNLREELNNRLGKATLDILRSDGGLSTAEAAEAYPVNMLMSGPAGGVSGALWIAEKAGYGNLLTFDMGGTSTDVCLVEDGNALTRRETTVGDVTVRASSIDVRTVGAGGGSIAHVPELTKALRVGPESAGAVPGPAAYAVGGEAPTVTDANIVLGYLPAEQKLGGDMVIDKSLAEKAVQQTADALGKPLKEAAEGIIQIVNENMFGALRLVSIEKGYDPRDFALVAFGGAGPLHANALGILMQSWPVIIPPGPGVLCAYGDATTRIRDEASKTFIRKFSDTSPQDVASELENLAKTATDAMQAGRHDKVADTQYQVDLRYHGQGLSLTVDADPTELKSKGFNAIGDRFDDLHEQLFTFKSDSEKEVVNLRAVVQGQLTNVSAEGIQSGGNDASAAIISDHSIFYDGRDHQSNLYDRSKLAAGNKIAGPAIVMEMDSTTVILPDYVGEVDRYGNILIRPAQIQ
jgi:N-methylhydantoinase A